MFKSLMFLTALCSGVGMPVAFESASNTEEVINFEYQNKKFVSYDDELYTITLTANELNHYTWDNFINEFDNYTNQVVLFYNSQELTFGDNEGSYSWTYDDINIYFIYSYADFNGEFETIYEENNIFVFEQDHVFDDFVYSLELECSSLSYSDIKSAIELDVQANTAPRMGNILTEVVSLLVGGIVPFATGIGQGVSDLVSYTFIDNGALSVFGAMIAVFAGIALAVGLSRWVMNFLTSLGAKK